MWIVLFALFSPFTPQIDLYVSGLFYVPEAGFYNNTFLQFMFQYGERFGFCTGGAAALLFLLSFLRPKWKKFRHGSLAMLLTLVLGAGLITNVVLKGYWGRPRPKQIEDFGGKHLYRPFWHPNFNTRHEPQKSFPSGHAAMGFYFFSLCLIGKRYQNRLLLNSGIVLTLCLGGGLMVTRVIQGGHFVSDVVASAVLMWYVALAVDKLTWAGFGERVLDSKSSDSSQALDAPLTVSEQSPRSFDEAHS